MFLPLQNIAYTVLLLGVLVFVHEFGHFIVAKALNVKVLRFSIGFGPRIFGFKRGETEYRVAWLPLGGYVKMAGELPYEELPPEEAKRGFLAQAPWKRMLIVAAGPGFNLIFPILVYFLVSLGAHERVSTRIGAVERGLPAAEAGLKPGDRILAIDGQKVRTFDELRTHLQPRYDHPVSLTVERNGEQFVAQLTPAKTVETNPIETIPRGMIGISPYSRPPVVGVPAGSVAASAGLKTFDRIVQVNSEPVRDEPAFNAAIAKATGRVELQVHRSDPLQLPGAAALIPRLERLGVEKQPGEGFAAIGAEPADLYIASVIPGSAADKAGIKPGDRLLQLNGKDLKSWAIFTVAIGELGDKPFALRWRSGTTEKTAELRQTKLEVRDDDFGQGTEVLDLGLRPLSLSAAEVLGAEKVKIRLGVREALATSLRIVPEIIRKTAQVIGYLVTGRVPFKSVGGPIMLYQIAAKSAEEGVDSFLSAMAVISINLGLMNLLPIPILDGFHLFAAAWEGIRRRPIPMRAREIANMVGLAMLLLLMVMVFKNDIMRLRF
jgi:regulator of sigma E protease